ncbi:hypothetical protein POM88_040123 [Heracleum sosnowskyi]|uniref:Uncharacterized protein n=1 Tax=Heracleum sosnowskyi TaxID=360622 RepID=A0AAD8M9I3_9APIA|nr:hypothetical protein POM88_040123 [Heracleum sosnowskyi]
MSSRKKLQFGNTTASPTKEGTTLAAATEEEETDDSGKKVGLAEYLKKFEVAGGGKESENDVEKHCEVEDEQSRKATGEGQGCNEYEMNINKRVAENKKKVAELGLKKMAIDLCQNNKGKAKQTHDQSESDYSPDNEVEPGSDETVISKKNKKVKKVVAGAGPRTRSQASKVVDSCDKQAHAGSFSVEENDASTVPLGEKLKNIKSKAPGSMAAYLELRELQKTQSEIELSQSQSQAEHLQSQSEADEERLEHRPRNIPLQDFKILLKYWGDEDVQTIAKRNTEARSQVTDTHTAGPVSFAQICNKLVLERPQVDVDADQDQDQDPKEAQPPRPLSEADIFIATRKRDEKHTYKLPTDAVQKKIVSI